MLAGELQTCVERGPAHQLSVQERLCATADLPDAATDSSQCSAARSTRSRSRSHASADGVAVLASIAAVAVIQGSGAQHLAEDVELTLLGGGVADPHRPRAAVALKMVQTSVREASGGRRCRT